MERPVQKVILVLLHCTGILLSNGNDRLINADKLPSLQIVYILKIDDVGTVDSFKGSGKKLLFQILNVAVKLNRRPIFQMNFNNSVFYFKIHNIPKQNRANGFAEFIGKGLALAFFSQGNGPQKHRFDFSRAHVLL